MQKNSGRTSTSVGVFSFRGNACAASSSHSPTRKKTAFAETNSKSAPIMRQSARGLRDTQAVWPCSCGVLHACMVQGWRGTGQGPPSAPRVPACQLPARVSCRCFCVAGVSCQWDAGPLPGRASRWGGLVPDPLTHRGLTHEKPPNCCGGSSILPCASVFCPCAYFTTIVRGVPT